MPGSRWPRPVRPDLPTAGAASWLSIAVTVVARMLRALALSGCVAVAAAGGSPVSHSPAAGSSASPGWAATSVSPIPTWDDQQPGQGPGPLGPRMDWALIMAGSSHPKRILFPDTHNLGGPAV